MTIIFIGIFFWKNDFIGYGEGNNKKGNCLKKSYLFIFRICIYYYLFIFL